MLQLAGTSLLSASLALAAKPSWNEIFEKLDIKEHRKHLSVSDEPWYDPENPYNKETYAFPPGHSPYRAKFEHITDTMAHISGTIGDIDDPNGEIAIHISYPLKTGRYPWVDLHHAFQGITPESLYNELKREIVTLGYIVFYTEPFRAHDPEIVNDYSVWEEAHDFYMAEGPEIVYNSSLRHGMHIELDPHRGGYLCHGDGCDITKEFAIRQPQSAGFYYFVDPVFDGIQNSEVPVELDDNQVVLVGRTDHCSKCCMYANFEEQVFDSFTGMKLKTKGEYYGMGQCSLLNWYWAESCRASNLCDAPANGRTDALQFHKRITATLIAAGTQSNFEDRDDMQKFYTDPAEIPVDFYVNGTLTCVGATC
jgi:hypothetical protein